MTTISKLNTAVAAVLKADGKVAVDVQSLVLEAARYAHGEGNGNVLPLETLLKGLSARAQLQRYLFNFFPLCWKKDKDTGNTTLALRKGREDADWQHDAAALVKWNEFGKVAKPQTIKGLKELRTTLKRVVDGENWNSDAKKVAEKCLELVEDKVAAKPATPEALFAQFAAFMQAQAK